MYYYLKAIHIIFIVTWFAGLFYIVRLFIYNTEANERPVEEKRILQPQFSIMIRRLWLGITWPSAILTAILGPWVMLSMGYEKTLGSPSGNWLLIKIIFVILLYFYHFSLHRIYKEEAKGVFRYTSNQLRIWNELATVLLVAIIMLATVKQSISWVWGVVGIIGLVIILMAAIKIYKKLREG
jgi:protoporphyrinogen IX oxidase